MKMTRFWKPILRAVVVPSGILLAATLAGCGGSVVTGGGSTAVTVTVGAGASTAAPATASSRTTPRPLAATIPTSVTTVRFTISGADIDNIVQTVPVTGTTVTVTLQVPSGPARTILVEALDSDGTPRFRGMTVIDASGVALAVTIDMAIDPSNPALLTWNPVANTSTSGTLYRVARGDGIALAAGSSGEILSSTDGISWTSRTPGNITGDISALAFGDNTFLAMTSTGNFTAFPATWTNRFFGATSDNVSDWTARGIVGTVGNPLLDITFGDGIFVAVGDNNAFYSMDNGATWAPGTISGVSYLSAVSFGNGLFVATDAASDNVAVSADGILWTPVSLGLTSPETLERIGFGGGLFLITTSSGDVYTSPDGSAWTGRTRFADLAAMDASTNRISAGGGGFMVVISSGLFFTFDSGASWTAAIDPGGSVYDGTYWNGAFIAVGSTGPGSVLRSGDL